MHAGVELVCPAGSLPALKAAVDNGADCVYMGFRDATNARNFPGLNFDDVGARRAVEYAHARGARVFLALNTYPQPDAWRQWTSALDRAAALGVDAVILADPGLLAHAARQALGRQPGAVAEGFEPPDGVSRLSLSRRVH